MIQYLYRCSADLVFVFDKVPAGPNLSLSPVVLVATCRTSIFIPCIPEPNLLSTTAVNCCINRSEDVQILLSLVVLARQGLFSSDVYIANGKAEK